MPPRFLAPDATTAAVVALPPDEGEHLRRVLRLGPGARVHVFDGRGHEWAAEVTRCDRHAVEVRLDAPQPVPPEPAVPITLAAAVLKGDGMDDVVRDAVMLGAAAVWPVVTARTEVSLGVLRRAARVARWRRVAVASAKQCGRAVLPPVLEVAALDAVLGRPEAHACRLVLVEPGVHAASVPVMRLGVPRPASAVVLVGPEGGWTADEVDAAVAAGWSPVSLGPRTLRAVSVPVVAMTALAVAWGDL
jgi:16S rRNA (uracil1498-N3)-methyltransferase